MKGPEIDTDLIDEAVLALMYLTLHGDPHSGSPTRAWKAFDWDAMARLHAKDLIFDPVGKSRSVMLTEEGRRRSEAAFHRLFARKDSPPQKLVG